MSCSLICFEPSLSNPWPVEGIFASCWQCEARVTRRGDDGEMNRGGVAHAACIDPLLRLHLLQSMIVTAAASVLLSDRWA